jgi:hypothetical protein
MLLGVTAGCAALAGIVGHVAASQHLVMLIEPLSSDVPADRHIAFLTDLWIHSASYFVGFVGGVAVCLHVWRSRTAIQQAAIASSGT